MNLDDGDVGRELPFHPLDPLQRKSERAEIGHEGADVPVLHKPGQRQLGLAAQEVELHVQAGALLRQNRINTQPANRALHTDAKGRRARRSPWPLPAVP